MKKFRVEFNTTGFIAGQGIWVVLDETAEIESETAQEAIELVIDWFVETDENYGEVDCDEIKTKYEEYAWKAAEIKYDADGVLEDYEWEYRD